MHQMRVSESNHNYKELSKYYEKHLNDIVYGITANTYLGSSTRFNYWTTIEPEITQLVDAFNNAGYSQQVYSLIFWRIGHFLWAYGTHLRFHSHFITKILDVAFGNAVLQRLPINLRHAEAVSTLTAQFI